LTRREKASLRHDAAWAMAGGLAQTANQAAMMFTLAQMAPARIVGQYALGLAIAAPLNVFADRTARMLQATASEDDFPLNDYLAVRTLVGLSAIVVSAMIVGVWQLGTWTGIIVLLVAAGRLAEGVAQTLYGRFQRGYQMRQIGQSQVLRAGLATGASLVCLIVWQRLDVALVASILANLMVIHHLDRPRIEQLERESSVGRNGLLIARRCSACGRIVRLALPLAASTFFVSLSANLPRLFLSRSEDESTLGVFVVLCYLCLPATMVVSAVMQAATPRLAEYHREGRGGRYRRLVRQLSFACAGVAVMNGVLIHGLGPMMLRATLSDEYVSAAGHLDAITAAIGVGFVATVPATAMNAQRLFRLSLLTCCASCGTTFLVSAVLIPRLGMAGAAWAMLLSSGVHWLMSWTVLRMAPAAGRAEITARPVGAIDDDPGGTLEHPVATSGGRRAA
jgi:O-antigen/teichoic acid export membrane protein